MRNIPGWYELDWAHVADFLSRWEEPGGADLSLDATDPLPTSLARLTELLAPRPGMRRPTTVDHRSRPHDPRAG